ncbi:APC family permease [Anaeromyxobacter paludicola]|uniref:DNA-binding protein n=1 Tax=Anaeromyxobacter paludicola TaxID=2918171 RepID=A0ABN6NAB5_9BACT|nr:APC family permease [Anaeromyxobacter paludicola]BDG10182.1 DNA-binding protein [Anaeromyxobacter paludicola]
MRLANLLLGRAIPDRAAGQERIGPLAGVPVLGLDALASAAYGPEAALVLLTAAGSAAVGHVVPVTAVIVALLVVVGVSYRQTISAYPNGGGSYTVAKENLGEGVGLLAAASLAVDYLLNVAVAISAGVGALVSAVPALHRHLLPLCLALLALLTVVNLRGVREAGLAILVPTWLFVACLLGAVGLGIAHLVAAGGHPAPLVPPRRLPAAVEPLGLWLLLRAFASGCTAMTGVETVSNGVPIFREPRTREAGRTLATIVAVLVALLAGVAVLARAYGIGATDAREPGYQSVLSQLVGAVAGRGVFYGVTMGAVVAVLCLSANASFAGFPRLCRVLAQDRYLPEAFAHSNRRLVYGTGILLLAVLSGLLLAGFGGITDRLIPLFAVGAFGAFTLSQAGMVRHWKRQGGRPASLAVNAVGAAATGATLVVVAASKLLEGAWISILCVGALWALFRAVRRAYDRAEAATCDEAPLELGARRPPLVLVPVKKLDKVTRKALRFALEISPEVRAVQVLAQGYEREDLTGRWEALVAGPARAAGFAPPRLEIVRSQYRRMVAPIVDHARALAATDRERFVAVLVPELIEKRWYHYLLHSHTATALKVALLFEGGPQVLVIDAPWYLRERRRGARQPLPGDPGASRTGGKGRETAPDRPHPRYA